MITSLFSLIALLVFFSVLGLGVASAKMVKERLAIIPALGFGAVIGLGYVLSANFKWPGALAMTAASALLLGSVILRSRILFPALLNAWQTGAVNRFLFICLIPMFTLLVPALFYGFDYFYGSVNFDFFYNSQESWFLKTHDVLQYLPAEGKEILPLSWSSNFQGRFAVSLIAAFFSYWTNADVLQFNSLLLNTLVVLFALSLSVFCRELFRLGVKGTACAVFFSVLSAGFVQSYSYYLLGQLSALPVFIAYCIFLKSLLDKVSSQAGKFTQVRAELFMLAVLFNILYILYVILGMFALFLTVVSYFICCYRQPGKNAVLSLVKMVFLTIVVFCLIRISAIPESINIIREWVTTSSKVAAGSGTIIVFSEYLKDSFLAILFGIVNYPSTVSLFGLVITLAPLRNVTLFLLGIGALATFLLALKSFANARDNSKGSQAVILALAFIVLACAFYFFFSQAPYAIFKIQTWFMPLLIPIYLFAFNKKVQIGKKQFGLSTLCFSILALNVGASAVYMGDFFAPDKYKRYANVRGITGSKDVTDLASKLNDFPVNEMSLLLNNGIEAAWVANFTRKIRLNAVTHNYQPLEDINLPASPCANVKNLTPSELWVMTNPHSIRSDVTDAAQGGKVVYQNDSFIVLDPVNVSSFVYFGNGSYPVELNLGRNTAFPRKFRWISKGVEIMVYSSQDRVADLSIEVTPGYVVTKSPVRQISILTEAVRRDFSIDSTTLLTVADVKLRKGLTCLFLESPDEVTQPRTAYGILRPGVPFDTRLTNFAVSYVGIK